MLIITVSRDTTTSETAQRARTLLNKPLQNTIRVEDMRARQPCCIITRVESIDAYGTWILLFILNHKSLLSAVAPEGKECLITSITCHSLHQFS